ncbi:MULTISPECIES: 3-dehydroquinate synthase [Bizionia]|uniref:3-dehydroquinate synthase n=1 Tax=Bizionia algoritergicola TaxID=291187 RepID=A0A5D0QY83_9FLAO|nr:MULTISPECIES: 3-dehydroquinate synthase [Bizionia]OBX24189.1 3-dehydroquinate synthase [Bizionia sp. APA-3]TYB73666.1 3-dehydroquinate synthase [Bizionia algoritergicola]
MKSIQTETYPIHFNSNSYTALNTHLKQTNYSLIFILVDENTHNLCLTKFLQQVETTCTIEIIEIESGEEHKTIETCVGVWNVLSELGADRKSLIINLGGGVVTDLGGFVASTFKRGINYINVPTSLLAMVDASVGGKTGVDLGHLKNQIGVINSGEMVLIDTSFLETLPENQMRSGLAEMLKHGLIYSRDYWNKFTTTETLNYDDLIYESVIIKNSIVTQDPLEENLRKTLNYGHTLGHAIESYFLSHPEKEALLHGEAVAIGMILANYISTELTGLSKVENDEIKTVIKTIFGEVTVLPSDYDAIIELLKYDKKNEHGNINFVLLEDMGKTKINCLVSNDVIVKAFEYYKA